MIQDLDYRHFGNLVLAEFLTWTELAGPETYEITEVLVHHGAASDAMIRIEMVAIGSGEIQLFCF